MEERKKDSWFNAENSHLAGSRARKTSSSSRLGQLLGFTAGLATVTAGFLALEARQKDRYSKLILQLQPLLNSKIMKLQSHPTFAVIAPSLEFFLDRFYNDVPSIIQHLDQFMSNEGEVAINEFDYLSLSDDEKGQVILTSLKRSFDDLLTTGGVINGLDTFARRKFADRVINTMESKVVELSGQLKSTLYKLIESNTPFLILEAKQGAITPTNLVYDFSNNSVTSASQLLTLLERDLIESFSSVESRQKTLDLIREAVSTELNNFKTHEGERAVQTIVSSGSDEDYTLHFGHFFSDLSNDYPAIGVNDISKLDKGDTASDLALTSQPGEEFTLVLADASGLAKVIKVSHDYDPTDDSRDIINTHDYFVDHVQTAIADTSGLSADFEAFNSLRTNPGVRVHLQPVTDNNRILLNWYEPQLISVLPLSGVSSKEYHSTAQNFLPIGIQMNLSFLSESDYHGLLATIQQLITDVKYIASKSNDVVKHFSTRNLLFTLYHDATELGNAIHTSESLTGNMLGPRTDGVLSNLLTRILLSSPSVNPHLKESITKSLAHFNNGDWLVLDNLVEKEINGTQVWVSSIALDSPELACALLLHLLKNTTTVWRVA